MVVGQPVRRPAHSRGRGRHRTARQDRLCCTGASDRQAREQRAQGSLHVTSTAGMPASGRDTGRPLPSAVASRLCTQPHLACCRAQAAWVREAGRRPECCSCPSWVAGTPIPHSSRTPCAHLTHTVCAARHARRLTRFCVLCLCVARRARQAGLKSKSVLPAIADLYVEERLAGSLRTASYGPEKCALWPMVFGSLESVGVGSHCVIFFIKNACTCKERHFFLWLAPKRRSRKTFFAGGARAKKADFSAPRPAIQKNVTMGSAQKRSKSRFWRPRGKLQPGQHFWPKRKGVAILT